MKFLSLLLPLLLWLSGCSTVIKPDSSSAPDNLPDDKQQPQSFWNKQQIQLNKIQQWNMSGRLSVQTTDDGGQADFTWQQTNPGDYQIRIQAPLGAGTTWIKSQQGLVEVTSSNGGQASDTDVDRLLSEITGWPLPVSGLYYWVRGLPSSQSDYEIKQWHTNGLPKVLLQDGWRIEFRKHRKLGEQLLPGKIFIKRITQSLPGVEEQEVDVRLIIRQWGLDISSLDTANLDDTSQVEPGRA